MTAVQRNNGSVLIVVVFTAALLAAVTVGILQMTTEEIQLAQNHIGSVKALDAAEAGLNDALARIRQGSDPNIAGGSFTGGSYVVTAASSAMADLLISSTGVTSAGFTARVDADVTISNASPYAIRIDRLRINE